MFCHGRARVKFIDAKGGPQCCELADLLLVVDVGDATSFVRTAALIQAKMARAAERVSLKGDSSKVQLDLYKNWYRFDFEESVYGLSQIDFTMDGAESDSGTIGVIDRHFKTQPIWTQHAATPTPLVILNAPRLGTFVAEMVGGARPGFGRLATPVLQTDWSKTVEQLLRITYARAFHDKATLGPTGAPRGVHAVACFNFKEAPNLLQVLWGGWAKGPPSRS